MRLIDADAAEKALFFTSWWDNADQGVAIRVIDKMPTIDAEPVRHGRCDICDTKETGRGSIELYGTGWLVCIRQQGATYDMIINHRGDQISIPIEFCPDCGAKLGAEPKPQEPRKVCPATGLECIECVPGYGCAKTEGGASDENA